MVSVWWRYAKNSATPRWSGHTAAPSASRKPGGQTHGLGRGIQGELEREAEGLVRAEISRQFCLRKVSVSDSYPLPSVAAHSLPSVAFSALKSILVSCLTHAQWLLVVYEIVYIHF
jgi:hypothetical protein